jgi:hypothetical protein
VSGQPQLLGEVRSELAAEGVDDKTGIARGEVLRDFRILLLVADDGTHRGQAARNTVHAGGNALTEREGSER